MHSSVVFKNHWLLAFGIAAPILRQLAINITTIFSPGYSLVSDFLSELGAQGAPHALFFNFFGIILVGIFTLFGAVGLYYLLKEVAGGQLISLLYIFSGTGFVLLGFFPCPDGCLPDIGNSQMKMHMLAGTLGLGTQVWAPLAFALIGFANGLKNSERITAFILGLFGVTAYIYLVFFYQDIAFAGLLQRLVQLSADLWLLIISFNAFSKRYSPY